MANGPSASSRPEAGEEAEFWFSVLTAIKNWGVDEVCVTVCDGLKGLPNAIMSAMVE